MAKTVSLNRENSVYVTTFYSGALRGRIYGITVCRDGYKVSLDLDDEQLFNLIHNSGGDLREDNGLRPIFDN